ncbi:MAG: hypothetical protein IJ779_07210 [Ruminococcus sp.]|nr:hypothetical protein [Ruminococcus sp.]
MKYMKFISLLSAAVMLTGALPCQAVSADGALKGDVNGDQIIDGRDATDILTEYSKTSAGQASILNDEQKALSEVTGDNVVDGRDATLILTYYAFASTGNEMTLPQYLERAAIETPATTTAPSMVTTTTSLSASTVTTETSVSATDAESLMTTVTETTAVTTTTANSGLIVNYSDRAYCLWADTAPSKDFIFNGQVIKVTFKIKEDAPDGDYTVKIKPDLSNIEGITIIPDIVSDGIIRVGNGDIKQDDYSGESGFVIYGDNAVCKQGETVDYYINFSNNTGLAAFLIWLNYDKNAMEITNIQPVGEFESVMTKGTFETGSR